MKKDDIPERAKQRAADLINAEGGTDWLPEDANIEGLASIRAFARYIAKTEAQAPACQHVAYFDEGAFHWMSGIAPRDCELYAKWKVNP